MKDRYILGVHSGHDASACLLKNNKIVCAIEKERLSRKKHDSGEPIECIEYVLNAEGISYSDVELVVRVNWYNSTELNDKYFERFRKVIVRYEHHLFHAYAVSLTCQDKDMLAYIVDGRGCRTEDNGEEKREGYFESESLYKVTDKKVKLLEHQYAFHHPNQYHWGSHMDSVGYAYADISRLIFGDYNAAGKVMALASFGKPNKEIPCVFIYDNSNMTVNKEWLEYINNLQTPIMYESQIAKDLAYSIQQELEKYFDFRLRYYTQKYNCKNVALSGGVALNCKNNGLIANSNVVDSLNIFPACGDNGLSIGAVVWAARELYDDREKIIWKYGLGKKYKEVLYDEEQIASVSDKIYKEEIIGLFENESEFGPRALCNRSIITSARNRKMKDRLNMKIKKREAFRPFGGVILERNISLITDEIVASDYMLAAVHIKEEMKDRVEALIHEDGTIRLQIVRDNHSAIWYILNYMERKYGDIILLNTSFNCMGEPIVETEKDAYLSAKQAGIKHLFINGRNVTLDEN